MFFRHRVPVQYANIFIPSKNAKAKQKCCIKYLIKMVLSHNKKKQMKKYPKVLYTVTAGYRPNSGKKKNKCSSGTGYRCNMQTFLFPARMLKQNKNTALST
jgi:hypothetical protein